MTSALHLIGWSSYRSILVTLSLPTKHHTLIEWPTASTINTIHIKNYVQIPVTCISTLPFWILMFMKIDFWKRLHEISLSNPTTSCFIPSHKWELFRKIHNQLPSVWENWRPWKLDDRMENTRWYMAEFQLVKFSPSDPSEISIAMNLFENEKTQQRIIRFAISKNNWEKVDSGRI